MTNPMTSTTPIARTISGQCDFGAGGMGCGAGATVSVFAGGGGLVETAIVAPPPPAAAPLANQLYAQTNETVNTVVHMVRAADGSMGSHTPVPGDPVARARVRLFLFNFEKELFSNVNLLEGRGVKADRKSVV